MTGEPEMVPNPYKAAVLQAIESARPLVTDCVTALDNALAGFRGEAWVSGAGDAFGAALTANDRNAGTAGQDCIDALQRVADNAPAEVVAGGADVHWRRTYA